MSGERHAVTLITHAIIGDCRPTNPFLNELLLVAKNRTQGLCEIRGGRPGLPSQIVCTVSLDIEQH